VFAGCAHGFVLALQFALFGPAALAEEEHPGTVDGPVAEVPGSGEVEGAGCLGVREVVADGGWDGELAIVL
jgi:hypothetical protein